MYIKSMFRCSMIALVSCISTTTVMANTFALEETFYGANSQSLTYNVTFDGVYNTAHTAVLDITNAYLSLYGNKDSVSAFGENSSGYLIDGQATVGFDVSNNNFLFVKDYALFTDYNYFPYVESIAGSPIISPSSGIYDYTIVNDITFHHGRVFTVSGSGRMEVDGMSTSITGVNYSLTETIATVPLPETYIMFTVGLLVLSLARKKAIQA